MRRGSANHAEAGSTRIVPSYPGAETRIGVAELDDIFRGLDSAARLVLAVSGGPDSMALMHLASGWAASGLAAGRRRPILSVATVDHGLRPEAAAEAAFVAAAAARLGLPHATLNWEGPKPATRRQERARAARYALLAAHTRALGAAHVLTAHHADDQAETVLMRLGRGSGVAGLAAMRRETQLADGVTLVRPFLEVPKATLAAVCRHEGVPTIEDPSNRDLAFARVRLRRQAEATAALGLDRIVLLRLAERMRRADLALADASARLAADLAPVRQPGLWRAVLAPISGAAPELLQRVLRGGIEHVAASPSGGVRALRLDRLEALADNLAAALEARRPLHATLSGTRIVLARDTTIEIVPEAPRRRGRRHDAGQSRPLDAAHLPSLGKP